MTGRPTSQGTVELKGLEPLPRVKCMKKPLGLQELRKMALSRVD